VNSKSDENGDDGPRLEPEVEEAFSRLVSEGSNRLDRPLVPLLAAAAFPIGYIALLPALSELFTENFLVPVTARISGRGSWPA
jgi:formate/nitrite transporter FocA (FNT family)